MTLANTTITLYGWDATNNAVQTVRTLASADAAPRAVALGDVDGDAKADWLYSDGTSRIMVYGSGATYPFTGYNGLMAAPGDVDGDGRADILLANTSGAASLIGQPTGGTPTVFATIAGVDGAANAPYASGADANSDGSADLLLIPTQAAAQAHGFDAVAKPLALDFSSGFISPQSLPLGLSSASLASDSPAPALTNSLGMLGVGLLSVGPDIVYVDDDAVNNVCDGHSPCYPAIQDAVAATDGGGDTVIVYPGVYDSFRVGPYAKNVDLTIEGVSADAVFVEGTGTYANAIQIAAPGVHISNLTVRNAVAGIVLEDGGGEAPAGSGNETVIDHVVAHSVSYPISMTQTTALSVTDSTLVGDGTHPMLYVNPAAGGLYTWNGDRAVPAPINDQGTLVRAGSSLYALPGGGISQIYQATPGADGTLGTWTQPFSLAHALPTNTGTTPSQQGTNLLVGSATMLSQLHSSFSWPLLGGEANNEILALAIDPSTGDVYAGGSFTTIGGAGHEFYHIARWDGTSWHALGTGTNGTVNALAFGDNGNLYVGGSFTTAGGLDAQNIARWDGSSWSVLGLAGKYDATTYYNGVNGPVNAIEYDGSGRLYIGGTFSVATEYGSGSSTTWVTANNLAIWLTGCTPSSSSVCFGQSTNTRTNGEVQALGHSGSAIYVAGRFTSVGVGSSSAITANYVAAYNPQVSPRWIAFGGGVSYGVRDLVVGPGTGLTVVSLLRDKIWQWNGTSWIQAGGSYNGAVALAIDAQQNVYTADGSGYLRVQPGGSGDFVQMGLYQDLTTNPANWQFSVWALTVDGQGQLYGAPSGYNGNDGSLHGALSLWAPASFYRRPLTSGSWTQYAYPPVPNMWTVPTDMVGATFDGLYAIWGEYATGVLYFFNGTPWMQRASPPSALALKHLVWADGKLYATGRLSTGAWGFARYDPAGDSWTTLANPPIASVAAPDLSWTWDGGDHIYLLPADGTTTFARYSLSTNTWQNLPAPPTTFTLLHGPAMARVGSYLYVYETPGTGANVLRYGGLPASDQRLIVRRTAFVKPDSAGDFHWTNLAAATGTYRFRADVDTTNVWVGPSGANWQPGVAGATVLTSAQADFVAPEDGLYRVGPDSLLTAGYHHYKAVAHVYPSQAACTECASGSLTWGVDAFATIRGAVESGAARVLVHSGRYPQTFYLISGVDVMGTGAESTIVEPPAGTGGTLVSAEGVAGASVARLTLAGRTDWQGFVAEGGTTGVTLARSIIRDFSTGVRLRAGAEVAVINNTFARNTNGLVAESGAPINVRNTIFAYSSGVGLQYDNPPSLSNTYNDFWSNGTAIVRVGGQADPSLGSLFVDPRFRSLADEDLRLREDSPLIDAGAPGDPTVPGGGEGVDIGYAEFSAAAFYVSHRYSEVAINDGLTWGVDAFATIEGALDAAAAALGDLQGALPEGGYSVAVDTGIFTETVRVPSHVRLGGLGADVDHHPRPGSGQCRHLRRR